MKLLSAKPMAVLLALIAAAGQWAGADETAGREQLIRYLNGIARTQLEQRSKAIAQIQNQADAERRKAVVREKIGRLIGGVIEHRGPVAVKQFGTLAGDGFRIEKLAYESLPGFWVTANLYVPAAGAGPFPAVLLSPGHEATGKQGQYNFGGNFARLGIIALAIDPLGQGERLQYFDSYKKASTIGGSTGEHGEANVPALLIGENIARYFVNDLMRGVDYLSSRKDVNADRIGAFGCSGGGTATAYFAALDNRIKAAGSACFITSLQELLVSATGVQEAEQSLPHFIQEGLDFGDWIEVTAPKPYAIVSTTSDMFPFEGARQTYEEVKRIYKLYGAEERLQWITGPGGHGNLGPIAPAILGFFARHLKDAAPGNAAFTPMRPEKPADLLCTSTGQIGNSLGGETVATVVRARDVRAKRGTSLRDDIRALTAAVARPGSPPPVVTVKSIERKDGYRLENLAIASEPGIDIAGQIAIPERSGAKPAVLLMGAQAAEIDRLVKSGKIVMVLEPRPAPAGTEGLKSPYLGTFNLLSLRASLVGKTIVGMRVDDTIRAVDWLLVRKDVDASGFSAYGNGPLGVVLLHAAVLDSRIRNVIVEDTLASYRMIVDQPLHRNAPEVVIPGVLLKYDIGELMDLSGRSLTVVNPRDATGAPVDLKPTRNFRVLSRAPGDPLRL